jgi:membrane protease YdiL (CAAX protease family)
VVGVVIVFVLFLSMVFDVTALFGEVMTSFGALSLLLIAQNGLLILLVVYVVQMRYGQPLTALGIRWASGFVQVGKGVLVSLIALPLSAGAEIAEKLVIAALIGSARADVLAATEQSRNHLLALLKEPLTTREIAWLVVLVCVVVPIGEEIFFRGFLYGALRARLRLPLAVGLSALVFAIVHLPAIFTFLPILALGVLLALLYERTGTLLPGIIVHSINNGIAMLAALAGWNV